MGQLERNKSDINLSVPCRQEMAERFQATYVKELGDFLSKAIPGSSKQLAISVRTQLLELEIARSELAERNREAYNDSPRGRQFIITRYKLLGINSQIRTINLELIPRLTYKRPDIDGDMKELEKIGALISNAYTVNGAGGPDRAINAKQRFLSDLKAHSSSRKQ